MLYSLTVAGISPPRNPEKMTMQIPEGKYIVSFTKLFTADQLLAGLAFDDSLSFPATVDGYVAAQALYADLYRAAEADTVVNAAGGSAYTVLEGSVFCELVDRPGTFNLLHSTYVPNGRC